jgi:hypothetical protein
MRLRLPFFVELAARDLRGESSGYQRRSERRETRPRASSSGTKINIITEAS